MGTDHQVKDSVIFFDGVCNLCNSSVQFIIKRDKKGKFKFSSLQSSFAGKVLPSDVVKEDSLNSIILVDKGKMYSKSTAALRIARHLSGIWPALYLFMILPAPLRNWVYDIIARNRYRWFGKRDVCMMPSPDQKSRFIE